MTQVTAVKPAAEAKTCSECPNFKNFNESSGRGWCNLFDQYAREQHQQTNDCVLSSETATEELDENLATFPSVNLEEFTLFPTEEIDEADLPHSEYSVGSIVKVIDAKEHHSEWATFKVTECHQNPERYRNTESYLKEPDWYYSLTNMDESIFFLASEVEICDSEMSWNINATDDIF